MWGILNKKNDKMKVLTALCTIIIWFVIMIDKNRADGISIIQKLECKMLIEKMLFMVDQMKKDLKCIFPNQVTNTRCSPL